MKKPMDFKSFADSYCDDIGTDPLEDCFDEDVYYDAMDAYDSYLKDYRAKNGKSNQNG